MLRGGALGFSLFFSNVSDHPINIFVCPHGVKGNIGVSISKHAEDFVSKGLANVFYAFKVEHYFGKLVEAC